MNIVDIFKTHTHVFRDFPKPNEIFWNIESLKADAPAFNQVLQALSREIAPHHPDLLIAFEDRSHFIAALAFKLGLGFIMVYETGSLPGPKYGGRALEISADLLASKQAEIGGHRPLRIVAHDDIIAGGNAAVTLVGLLRQARLEVVHFTCLIEIPEGGRQKLQQFGVPMSSLVVASDNGFTAGLTAGGLQRIEDNESHHLSAGSALVDANDHREYRRHILPFSRQEALRPDRHRYQRPGFGKPDVAA